MQVASSSPYPVQNPCNLVILTCLLKNENVKSSYTCACTAVNLVNSSCPVRPTSTSTRPVSGRVQPKHSTSCVKIPVKLFIGSKSVSVEGLLDSGAAGNFISSEFARKNNLALTPCTSHLAVEVLDGPPLGGGEITHVTSHLRMQTGILHNETLEFYVINSPTHPLILDLPWLCRHDPHISWREGEVTLWSSNCHEHCLSHKSPILVSIIALTKEKP